MSGRFKLSIRDALGIVTVLALALTLLLVNRQNTSLKNRLETLSPKPYLRVYSDSPVRQKYSVNATIAVSGTFHPLDYSFTAEPKVIVRLVDVNTQQVVVDTTARFGSNPNGMGFTCTIRPTKSLSTGFYAIETTLFDGDEEIAVNSVVKHVVDAAYMEELAERLGE
ncbi:MAG: hypothetical protein AAFN77_24625 [Planctomycetota bacterium]